ncbi:MAG TPA: protein kinase [Thermoanaerobaculia bacterium]
MTLTAGTRLGPYEILSPLGAGGMGEVYRARDTRLKREVAIKILPEAFAQDAGRLARFQREAEALAALNHPNIAHIHGLEESEGIRALVLELVPGETLADRIARGPLPLDDALDVARQIALALEAAHERGIVHRDLKPANVKITPEGTIKVLDFGLAKALSSDGSSPDVTSSPTMTAAATQAGVVIGTAAYMSPEQARGKSVDRRADVWAFGALLYEMLSGRKAFEGETVSDTLAAVLKTDPDWARLPPSTPPHVRAVLRRCLERDRDRRLRDIGDVRLELDEARAEPAAEPARARRVGWGLAAAGLVLGALLGVLAAARLRPRGEAAPHFAMRRLTELPGPELHPDLSPDGRSLVYTSAAGGNRDIYLLRVGGDRAINLTASSSDDDQQAAISPDGETIVFRSERDGGGLFLMGLTGESVRRLTNGGYDPAWSPDGKRIAYTMEAVKDPYSREGISELWTADVASGKTTRLLPGDAVQPAWSPDGKWIAYWSNPGGQRDLGIVAAHGGDPRPLTNDQATDWSPEWSPDGAWLYFSSDRGGGMDLWRLRIDVGSGRAEGSPQRVTSGVRSLAAARFSSDGRRLTVMAYDRTAEIALFQVAADAPETLRPVGTLRPQSAHWCAPSPDARWLSCATTGSPEDLILMRTDGSELRRLTNDTYKDRVAFWSPDGEWIGFNSTRSGKWDLWAIRPDGAGLRRLTDLSETSFAVWSPNGRELILESNNGKAFFRIDSTRTTDVRSARRLLLPGGLKQLEPLAWSPADRVVGAQRDALRSGDLESLGVWDLQANTYRRFDLSVAGRTFGSVAGWLPDGRRFIARLRDGIAMVDSDSGTWRILRPGVPSDFLRMTADGRTLLVESERLDSDVWMLEREAP